MRAVWWSVIGTLGTLLVVIAACDDPSLTPNQFGVGQHPAGVFGSAGQAHGLTDNTTYGHGSYGGVTGLVNPPDDSTYSDQPASTYTVLATISIGNSAPGNWYDPRPGNSNLSVRIVPYSSRPGSTSSQDHLTADGTLRFDNLAPDQYHLVYNDQTGNDEGMTDHSAPDPNGRQHINLVGYYVSDSFFLRLLQGGTATMSYDLYWNTNAFPYIYSLNPQGQVTNDPEHPNYVSDTLVTYDQNGNGQFRFRGKEYTQLPVGSTPAPGAPVTPDPRQLADYRVVVYSADGNYYIEWISQWHQPDATGYVTIPPTAGWNGYTGNGFDLPDETNATDRQLPEGDYLYAIQFKAQGQQFPEDAPKPRDYRLQDRSFLPHFYGGSQYFPFHLKRAPKPANWATPAPTPTPSAAPVPTPSPTFFNPYNPNPSPGF